MSEDVDGRIAAAALRRRLLELGYAVAVFPPQPGQTRAWAINVYTEAAQRYPADTVWVDGTEFLWGPNYEHRMGYDATISEVAARIAETIGGTT